MALSSFFPTLKLFFLLNCVYLSLAEPIRHLTRPFQPQETRTAAFKKWPCTSIPTHHIHHTESTVTSHTSITLTKSTTLTTATTPACPPTAVQTDPITYTLPENPPSGVPNPSLGLTFGRDWGYIACKTFCSSSCPIGLPTCHPTCSTKGSCGNSNTTSFYLSGIVANFSNPQNWIEPTPPRKTFTLFNLYFTSGDLAIFGSISDSITVEITGISRSGQLLPPLEIILPKPTEPPLWFTEMKVDLVGAGYGDVSRLDFLPYFTGTKGSGGQGPGGVILAGIKIDGDGFGGPVRGEVYTPLIPTRC